MELVEAIFLGARAGGIQDSLNRAVMLDPRIVLLTSNADEISHGPKS
jgi:hypothetical protein